MTKKTTALITGASGGIGLEIARCLAEEGFDLVLVARSQDKLHDIAAELSEENGIKVEVLAADLTDQGASEKLHMSLKEKKINIDMLVNNAGVLHYGRFKDMEQSELLSMLHLNLEALVRLTYEFLPGLLKKKEGRILNVASIAAFQPVPLLAVYAATKAFVLSFSEALSVELDGTNVSITALCPGLTDTNMMHSVGAAQSGQVSIPGFVIGNPADVAKAGVQAALSGQVIVVPGLGNKIAVNSTRYQPRWLFRRLAAVLTKAVG